MKKAGRWVGAVLAVVLCLGLAACASDLDAAGYTKSVLDASYHQEYAEYAKFRDISEEEAKKEVQDEEEQMVEQQILQLGDVSEESKSAYLECVRKAGKLAKYEVKEAEKQEDGSFVVQIEATPSDIYQKMEGLAASMVEELTEEEQQKIVEDADALAEFTIKCLEKAMEENTYGEPEVIEIKVTQDKNEVYGIEDMDMQKIDDALFPEN